MWSWWSLGLVGVAGVVLLSIEVGSSTLEATGVARELVPLDDEVLEKWTRIKRDDKDQKPEWHMVMGPLLIANIEELKKLVNYPHWRKKLPPKQVDASARGFLSGGLAKLGETIDVNQVLEAGALQKIMALSAGGNNREQGGELKDAKSPTIFQRTMDLGRASKLNFGPEVQNREGPSKGVDVKNEDSVRASSEPVDAAEKGVLGSLAEGLLGRLFG